MPDEAELAEIIRERIELIPEEERTPEKEYAFRLSRCRECEHLQRGTCGQCGCYVRSGRQENGKAVLTCLRNGRHIRTIENEKLRYMQIPTRRAGSFRRYSKGSLGFARDDKGRAFALPLLLSGQEWRSV